MSPLRTDSSHIRRSPSPSLARPYCLIAMPCRRSSARCNSFAPDSRRPASMTPSTCSSCSSALSTPLALRRTSTWRSSAFDRQVPMIEQWSVSESSQILLRLCGCADAASAGGCIRRTTSDHRSSLINGTCAVAVGRPESAGGSGKVTGHARYIHIDIASMAENRSDEKGVPQVCLSLYSTVYSDTEGALRDRRTGETMSNSTKFYVDGQWVEPAAPHLFDVINPATEDVAGQISLGSSADVDRAVTAARQAIPAYSQTSREARLAPLRRIGGGSGA